MKLGADVFERSARVRSLESGLQLSHANLFRGPDEALEARKTTGHTASTAFPAQTSCVRWCVWECLNQGSSFYMKNILLCFEH